MERDIVITQRKITAIVLGLTMALVLFAGYFFAERAVFAAPRLTATYRTLYNSDGIAYATAISGYAEGEGELYVPAQFGGLPVTEIDSSAFEDCVGLTSIDFSDAENLTKIGYFAFKDCTSLSGTVTLPTNLKTIGSGVFAACTALQEVNLNDSLTELSGVAFSGATALTKVNFGNNVTKVGGFAFYNTTIADLVLPTSVTVLDDYALYGMPNLSRVEIFSDEIYFGSHCMTLSDNINEVVFHSENAYFTATADGNYLDIAGIRERAVLSSASEGEVEVPPYQAPDEIVVPDTAPTEDVPTEPSVQGEDSLAWLYISVTILSVAALISLWLALAVRLRRKHIKY